MMESNLIEHFIWFTRMCQVVWCSRMALKDIGKLG